MNFRAREEVRWALDHARTEIKRISNEHICNDNDGYQDGWYDCIHYISDMLSLEEE